MSVRPLALVTGASTGIGREIACRLAEQGHDLVLTSRSEAVLQSLAGELGHRFGVEVLSLALDLARPGAAAALAAALSQRALQPDVLVNNAGIGGLGAFDRQDHDAIEDMLMLNVLALTELTRLLLPGMLARGSGRILQMASAGAFMPGPLHAVYYASKAYVLSLSEALSVELEGTGVTVTTVCPGPTDSAFLARAGGPARNVFPSRSAAEIAAIACAALQRAEAVVVPGLGLRATLALLPRRVLARVTLRRNRRLLQAGPTAPGPVTRTGWRESKR